MDEPQDNQNQNTSGQQNKPGNPTSEYIKSIDSVQESKRKRRLIAKIFLWVLGISGLVVGGISGFRAYQNSENPEEPAVQQQVEEPLNEVAPTEEYSSTDLGLSLELPVDWSPDESTDGRLVLTSPIVEVHTPDDSIVNSKIEIIISENFNFQDEYGSWPAIAAADSSKLVYTSPSEVQRGETYVSFISFSDPGAVDSVFITGDSAYAVGADVMQQDIELVEPTIVARFYKCGDDICEIATADPLAIDPDAWGSDPALQNVEDILRSLTIK